MSSNLFPLTGALLFAGLFAGLSAISSHYCGDLTVGDALGIESPTRRKQHHRPRPHSLHRSAISGAAMSVYQDWLDRQDEEWTREQRYRNWDRFCPPSNKEDQLYMHNVFVDAFDGMAEQVHALATKNGFWQASNNVPEKIALIHSELSEALEAYRHGNPPDDKVPEYNGATVELADVIIRIMDLCQHEGWPVAEALVEKHAFNKTRPYLHGKKF